MGVLPLVVIIFFTISGGPYGLEPLLYYCGGKGALFLLILTPLLWDIPIILTVSELNCLLPMTGGYYQWIKRALGLRWAFYEGWWSWLCNFVDLAIYPQLLILYASLFFPDIAAYKIPVCLLVIWGCAYLNILGIRPVGKTSVILGILTLIPFIILFIIGVNHYPLTVHLEAFSYHDKTSFWGMAVFTIIWNFIGWDNVTTYVDEVKSPTRSYLKTMPIAFLLILILYFGVILIAQNSGISPAELKDKGFPALGFYVSGKWLSVFISTGGIVSSIGMFIAVLLSISRIPEVMARDKLLPSKLYALHPKFKTPYISIITCACIVSFMVLWTFGELLVIDVTVYFAGIILEFISLILLRIKEPGTFRPFRIPLNTGLLSAMLVLPVAVYFLALSDIIAKSKDSIKPILFAVLMILSGEVAWQIIKLWNRRRASVS